MIQAGSMVHRTESLSMCSTKTPSRHVPSNKRKHRRGARPTPPPLKPLPGFASPHPLAAAPLPRHHDDPFDRMLIAQARIEGLTIVTRDPAFRAYGVGLLPA